LGKIAGIIGMIDASVAQIVFSLGTVQGNAGMTIGFEDKLTVGTTYRIRGDRLLALRTFKHNH